MRAPCADARAAMGRLSIRRWARRRDCACPTYSIVIGAGTRTWALRLHSALRGHSSAGRAPALQAGGRRFDPAWLHASSTPANAGSLWGMSRCRSCPARRLQRDLCRYVPLRRLARGFQAARSLGVGGCPRPCRRRACSRSCARVCEQVGVGGHPRRGGHFAASRRVPRSASTCGLRRDEPFPLERPPKDCAE